MHRSVITHFNMKPYSATNLIFCVLGLLGIIEASPAVEANANIEDRAPCRNDKVLQALQEPSRAAVATSFCQDYISVPTSTGTITYTPILAGVKIVTATVPKTSTKTEVETSTNTVTVSVTKTSTITKTVTVPHPKGKRTDVPIPPFLTQYPAPKISSACSCLSVPPPSTVITVTGPPLIYWSTSTAYTTVTIPTTLTSVTSVQAYITVTRTVTSTVTSTVTYY
jgi:hypothetical protein